MQIFYKKHFTKNVIFDFSVWFGVKIVHMFRSRPFPKKKHIAKYVFVSDKRNKSLEAVLTKDVILDTELTKVKHNDDANYLGYKKIILMVENLSKNYDITFKVLPKDSNFILGSDNTITRGTIIKWD